MYIQLNIFFNTAKDKNHDVSSDVKAQHSDL